MLSAGTISKNDFNLIKMTDDLDEIVSFTSKELEKKIKQMEDDGLTDLASYQQLKEFKCQKKS